MTEKSVLLNWRDEAYGSVSSAAVAFRTEVDPYPSDTAHLHLARVYKRHGFKINHTRASWINDEGNFTPQAIVADLEALGYSVEHGGAIPRAVTEFLSEATVSTGPR